MARSPLAEERIRQIVDATIRAIATHGITGASLGRIAEEAGMSRGHVRHFVGNREELLRVSARHFYSDGMIDGSLLPIGTSTVADALDHLFGAGFADPSDNVVVLGFVEAARSDPELAHSIVTAYHGTHALFAALLAAEHPHARADDCASVAYGVVAVALHHVFLSDIASSATGTAGARRVAERMVGGLA